MKKTETTQADSGKGSLRQAIHVPKGVILNTHGKISGNGVLHKTGDGIWNQYGDCSNTVEIQIEQSISCARATFLSKNVKVNHKAISRGCNIRDGSIDADLDKPNFHLLNTLINPRNHKKTSKTHYF